METGVSYWTWFTQRFSQYDYLKGLISGILGGLYNSKTDRLVGF